MLKQLLDLLSGRDSLIKNYKKEPQDTKDKNLLRSCSTVSLNAVEAWLDAGANVNALDEYGCTPLILCLHSFNKSPELIKVANLLLDRGADVNAGGRNAADLPKFKGKGVALETALHYAANLNARDVGGIKPLLNLVVRMVRDCAANIHQTNIEYTPWQYANHFHGENPVKMYLELCHLQDDLSKLEKGEDKLAQDQAAFIAEDLRRRIEEGKEFGGWDNKVSMNFIKDKLDALKAMVAAEGRSAAEFVQSARGIPNNIAANFAAQMGIAA